ncbi:MAG: P1 family peptidase [Deltaproteobacteria bacterium]|nr:P1 family peptidase [Deltaproteobacteria bacterium]
MPAQKPRRPRLRQLGVTIGRFPTGRFNAITDVKGVRVGHVTLLEGEGGPGNTRGQGPVRTGVTAILPNDNIYNDRLMANAFVLNGAGELTGVTQLNEWGLLETPIILTNTLSVGRAHDGCVDWMARRWTEIGSTEDVVIPVVGECDDSWLNDAPGRHVKPEHAFQALENVAPGPVPEGSVGGGTGMVCCEFKGGIGTSSRKVPSEAGHYTIGVLVMTNFGYMRNLRMDGVAVGRMLEPEFDHLNKRTNSYGSIICVVATDAPLLSPQIQRICKRAALGIGRAGSHAEHGSGEIVVGFSTANKVPRETRKMTTRVEVLLDPSLGNLYEATLDATEEAIHNALCAADDMIGFNGRKAPGLPWRKVQSLMARYRPGQPPAALVDPNAPGDEDTPEHEPVDPSLQPELPLGPIDLNAKLAES